MATLPLKSSRNEHITTPTIQPGLGPQWLSSFWADEENARWAEIRIRYRGAISCSSVVGQQLASFFASGIQKLVDSRDKCLNKLGQYVEKWNTNVWHLNYRCNINLLSLFVFFSHSSAVYRELWQKTGGENNTQMDCVLWTDDVTIMTSSSKNSFLYVQNRIPYKRIFRIFPILRINGMAPFCNWFMERPSYMHKLRTWWQRLFVVLFERHCDVIDVTISSQ